MLLVASSVNASSVIYIARDDWIVIVTDRFAVTPKKEIVEYSYKYEDQFIVGKVTDYDPDGVSAAIVHYGTSVFGVDGSPISVGAALQYSLPSASWNGVRY